LSASKQAVHVWTDGACLGNPGPGGWAALLRMGARERELVGHENVTTNNRMELMGAIAALEAMKKPLAIVLHTDSKYVLQGATEWVKGWARRGWKTADNKPVQNRDLWERLVAAAAPHQVEWIWVRGHSGHVENERVDALATAAARRASEQEDVSVKVDLEAQLGVSCSLAGTKNAEKKAPAWCVRGPGETGAHCLVGAGDEACSHAFIILERSTLKLKDKAGGSVSIATDDSGKGPEQDRLRAILRSIGRPPS
jgi:ribonuclease HI